MKPTAHSISLKVGFDFADLMIDDDANVSVSMDYEPLTEASTTSHGPSALTDEEKHVLADEMLSRWQNYKDNI